jgi:cyclopropane-fatty-acyl-phospholipid synthase
MHPQTMVNKANIANPGASAAAIQYHYDIGNDFYHLWLDPTKTYTCALWDSATDIEQAQIAKLDYHIQEARASHSKRVLDIGCGWGCALHRLVTAADVEQAVGLTLSRSQAAYIRAQSWPDVTVLLESWSQASAALRLYHLNWCV